MWGQGYPKRLYSIALRHGSRVIKRKPCTTDVESRLSMRVLHLGHKLLQSVVDLNALIFITDRHSQSSKTEVTVTNPSDLLLCHYLNLSDVSNHWKAIIV